MSSMIMSLSKIIMKIVLVQFNIEVKHKVASNCTSKPTKMHNMVGEEVICPQYEQKRAWMGVDFAGALPRFNCRVHTTKK